MIKLRSDWREEVDRVKAGKTRSHVSAARELADVAIVLEAERDAWKQRAMVAEASLRRCFPHGGDDMNEPIMQFFEYGHLKPEMQEVSKPFGDLAQRIVETLPRNAERTVALRKLLESKDAAVRAFIARPST